MTNQSELDELDEIINAALTRIVLAFGADDKSLIPKIKSDARKGVEAYITANYTPNSEVTDQVREARIEELTSLLSMQKNKPRRVLLKDAVNIAYSRVCELTKGEQE